MVSLAIVLLLSNLFPLPGFANSQHRPYLGPAYPHSQVIAEVIQKQPYLRSTIGLVANTAQINPMNVDFYGATATFQVYGRQLAFSDKTALQDSRALDWYLTKTGDQGAYNAIEAGQKALKTLVESSPDLTLHRTWQLPDASELRLYHRRTPPVIVTASDRSEKTVQLLQVTLPPAIPAGQITPITYTWSGAWADLRDGLVLLDWVPQSTTDTTIPPPWLHDHGIGLGQLYAGATPPPDAMPMQVVERLATQPPASLLPGLYTLQATYLNRQTGETYPLSVPIVAVRVEPQAAPQSSVPESPELDLPSQFRALAALLSQGKLEPVFNEIGRINQYDPIQDYMVQLETMLTHRLRKTPDRPDLLYPLGLVYVLQRRTQPAIASFTRLTELDSQNPWSWAYLGLAHLYSFHPQRATLALDQAEAIKPGISEVQTLRVVAAAMRLDVPKVQRLLKSSQHDTTVGYSKVTKGYPRKAEQVG
jgi:hypothetical protein